MPDPQTYFDAEGEAIPEPPPHDDVFEEESVYSDDSPDSEDE